MLAVAPAPRGVELQAALDAIVGRTHRDLSLVIDEALNAYLELHAGTGKRSPDGGADIR
jgi:hypothetical protein